MSNGKNPLMLMMALTMPGAAHALGLGDIHVESALNERLVAQIDIVGATALELADLRAAVANRDTFLRYGVDRPAFLTSAVFKVAQDSQGRPVLAVRSTEAFNEPVVNFLVDLHWQNGELVRQYTLLLDPAGFAAAPAAPVVPAVVRAATPIVETKPQTAARRLDPPSVAAARKTTHIKVGAKATLRGIAWRVGERSESGLQRMMIALFRANPGAFDGNINRLRRGAVLTIPSHAEVAAISKSEAKREVAVQMTAWHPSKGHALTSTLASAVQGAPIAVTYAVPAAVPDNTASPAATSTADASLDRRIESLEHELSDMKGVLNNEREQLSGLQEQAARAEMSAPAGAVAPAAPSRAAATPHAAATLRATAAPRTPSKNGFGTYVPVLAGLGGLAAALAALYLRFRRRAPAVREGLRDGEAVAGDMPGSILENALAPPQDLPPEPQPMPQAAPQAGTQPARASAQEPAFDDTATDVNEILTSGADDATHPLLPIITNVKPAGRSEIAGGTAPRAAVQDTTVNLRVDTVNMRLDSTRLDYNFVDLDMTAQHVQMPSVLNEHAVVKERRTNLADVLKMAIQREPDRHDLRMKLLELYYSAAATNRQAFLETVQKFARDRDYLQPDQWDKVAFMGRQIASENPMFAEAPADGDDLADCA